MSCSRSCTIAFACSSLDGDSGPSAAVGDPSGWLPHCMKAPSLESSRWSNLGLSGFGEAVPEEFLDATPSEEERA
jgi:hypothetical protein